METLDSYDELPYESQPLPETQPDVLAGVARLHGFDAVDPARARILELGCAQGGNLIPLAWRWPGCECVGVELSRVQADAGARFVSELGLGNARILHGDLAALPADLGEFDYIIAHGVYSWVPPAVQRALLDACRRHLRPSGLAYVSFNVKAGWDALQPLRRALIERTDAALSAPARYRQALEVLAALECESDDASLRKEIAFLKTAAPSYLFHEYLADTNEALTFTEFAGRIESHGLRYVGEAGARHAVVALEDSWGLTPEGMMGRWLDAEAALDDAHRIRFRRALIARDDAPCAQPADAAALDALAFYADVSSDEEIDLEDDIEQHFVNPAGVRFPVAQPALKAGMMALSAAFPQALAYADLVSAAGHIFAECGVQRPIDADAFRTGLFELVMAHAIMPTVAATLRAGEPGEQPRAHALARHQARSTGWVVSGARHAGLDVDVPARVLLDSLDGTQTLPELAARMQTVLGDAQACDFGTLLELTHRQLWLFARQGLLEA